VLGLVPSVPSQETVWEEVSKMTYWYSAWSGT